jgi:hypothetical protein
MVCNEIVPGIFAVGLPPRSPRSGALTAYGTLAPYRPKKGAPLRGQPGDRRRPLPPRDLLEPRATRPRFPIDL